MIKYGIYALIVFGVLGSLYTGYRVWRHSIWVEGRDAVLTAVAKQNTVAKEAAIRVERTTDQCFDDGGSWNVTTGKCDMGILTPGGAGGLLSD